MIKDLQEMFYINYVFEREIADWNSHKQVKEVKV